MGYTAGATDFRYVFSHSNEIGLCSLLFPGYVVDIIVLCGELIVILFAVLGLCGFCKMCRKIKV